MELLVDFGDTKSKSILWELLKKRRPVVHRVTFVEERAKRSDPQNAYYWGVCIVLIGNHIGLTPEEYPLLHERLKITCNPVHKPVPNSDEVLVLPGSTKSLTTVEFMDYLDRVKQWAIETLDLYIPDPNETISELDTNFRNHKNKKK